MSPNEEESALIGDCVPAAGEQRQTEAHLLDRSFSVFTRQSCAIRDAGVLTEKRISADGAAAESVCSSGSRNEDVCWI